MTRQSVLPRAAKRQRSLSRLHIWEIQAVRDVLVIVAAFALIWVGYAIRSVTVPLLVALLLAYLFEPLVSGLTRRFQLSRPTVVGGLLVTVGLSVLILLTLVIPLIVGQTMRFVQDVRAGRFQNSVLKLREVVPAPYQEDFERSVNWLMPADHHAASDADPTEPANAGALDPADPSSAVGAAEPAATLTTDQVRQIVREELARQTQPDVAASASPIWNLVRSSGRTMFDLLGSIVELGLLAFLIPFYFFFFSVSFPAVTKFGRDLIPVAQRPRTLAMIAKMDRAVAGFVRGRIVICAIVGTMLAVGWFIVGVPYSIVLGVVVGAFCLVPYLGGIGLPLAIGLLAFSEMQLPESQRMAWWAILLWPSVVFAIVQVVETYVLTPMVAGKATNLDPVTILVAVLAGGSIGGVYGMILAIPVAACLKIVIVDVLLPKVRAWTKGEADDPLPLGQ